MVRSPALITDLFALTEKMLRYMFWGLEVRNAVAISLNFQYNLVRYPSSSSLSSSSTDLPGAAP